jgi:hypothetical protein
MLPGGLEYLTAEKQCNIIMEPDNILPVNRAMVSARKNAD